MTVKKAKRKMGASNSERQFEVDVTRRTVTIKSRADSRKSNKAKTKAEKERDYKSFSTVAKSRFLPMAEALGYEQISPTVYAKQRDGWYEKYWVQSSPYGGDSLSFQYGIAIPDLCPVHKSEEILHAGLLLSGSGLAGLYSRATKADVEKSAKAALIAYRKEAIPWFAQRSTLKKIVNAYARTHELRRTQIGKYSWKFGDDSAATTYGHLLWKIGDKEQALNWLREAERIKLKMIDDEGPDDSDSETDLKSVRRAIRLIEKSS